MAQAGHMSDNAQESVDSKETTARLECGAL
jgi:hypothetical protein